MAHLQPSYPTSRQTGLLIEQVGDDTIVYDETRKRAHSLNRTAATVWRHCDGRRSLSQIAEVLSTELGAAADESVVQYALDRLEDAHLLEGGANGGSQRMSRRDALRRVTIAGAVIAVPVVLSIASPTPAMAQSPDSGVIL